MYKTALVCGAGGFIGGHLVKKLKSEGFWVRGVDIKNHEYEISQADDFIVADLRDQQAVNNLLDINFNEVYQLAADTGGAGFVFTGENDADIMHNSATINLNILDTCRKKNIKNIFYSSSAYMYPSHNQQDPANPLCFEESAYPANPGSEYGWEKLFSERLYLAYSRNYNLNVKIGRYHNIFGPLGTWDGGREKALAALCRKVAQAENNSHIEIWGSGEQTRSFLYIDECIEGTLKLMRSNFSGPVNIGSEEMISITNLAKTIIDISGKNLSIKNIIGPIGVMGQNSDNKLIQKKLSWTPIQPLRQGLEITYDWIKKQVDHI